jgi:hypothetical protein
MNQHCESCFFVTHERVLCLNGGSHVGNGEIVDTTIMSVQPSKKGKVDCSRISIDGDIWEQA